MTRAPRPGSGQPRGSGHVLPAGLSLLVLEDEQWLGPVRGRQVDATVLTPEQDRARAPRRSARAGKHYSPMVKIPLARTARWPSLTR
jgi:hypothetical protein